MVFKENKNIWKVCYRNLNDGFSCVHSYWTNEEKANNIARSLSRREEAKIIQCLLFECEEEFYTLDFKNNSDLYFTKVNVDSPSREEVLSKLTLKERKILGF